jgi:cytidylate kinase
MDQPLSIPTPEIVREAARVRGLSINEMSRRAKKHPDLFRRWARGNNASQETIQAWLDVINATPLQPHTEQESDV